MDEAEWNIVPDDEQPCQSESKGEEVLDEVFPIPFETIDNLSKGLLSLYLNDISQVSQSLGELKQNQNILIETIEQENEKYEHSQSTYSLSEMFTRLQSYQNKLVHLKKEMKLIKEKSQKLKQRALRLQSQRQQENMQKELQRQQELAKEEQLLARPISSMLPPKTDTPQ